MGFRRHWRLPLVIIAAAIVASGCIRRDSAATWYIDPAGRVTWQVLERDVRSDSKTRSDRTNEEAAYLAKVSTNNHGVARGLTRLGATQLKTTVLQDKPPFTVLTEGQFPGIDVLGQRIIQRFGLAGTSELIRDGDTWTWTLTVSDPKTANGTPDDGDEFAELLGDRLSVALREGRFLSGIGFVMDDEARIATMKKDDKLEIGEDGVLKLQLRWEVK